MSDKSEQKRMIGGILRVEGFALFFGGLFLATKPYYSEIVFLDAEMDLNIGYALILIGFINVFIANKFFKREAE